MLGDELHGLGGLGRLWTEQHGIRALRSPSVRERLASRSRGTRTARVMILPVDFAIRMMKIRELHHLHLGLGERRRQMLRQLGRTARVRRGGQRHVRDLHHPAQTRLLRPAHQQDRRQDFQEDPVDDGRA